MATTEEKVVLQTIDESGSTLLLLPVTIPENIDGFEEAVKDYIPTKLSAFANDKGFLTSAPVASVNGKTGTVVLSASDVSALPISGGTLTGNLSGQYGTFTWLQATESNHHSTKQNKVAVFDSSGWLYHRTLAEMAADLLAAGTSYVQTTMKASGWSSNQYSFERTYPFARYDIEIQPNSTCTQAQIEAWGAAMIAGSATSNVCKAIGTVPTIDIPIIIRTVKKV